jgi:hypothetical protein
LRSDLYRAPIRGIELLKGAAPTHLELNRECATELSGTIPNVRERRKPPLLIVFPVSHLGAIPTNGIFNSRGIRLLMLEKKRQKRKKRIEWQVACFQIADSEPADLFPDIFQQSALQQPVLEGLEGPR